MSELANKVRQLRGGLSQQEFARIVRLSHRTITKIEAGDKPKRANILQIAEKLRTDNSQRISLLLSWLRAEVGDADFAALNAIPQLTPPSKTDTLHQLLKAASNLREVDQKQLLLACTRRMVLNSISALNDLYDKVNHPDPIPPRKNSTRKTITRG